MNTDKIRTLGVYNSYDTDLANKCNFFSIVDNIENCLNLWSSRDLTLAGRIQISKTLAISKACSLHFHDERSPILVHLYT